MRETLTINLPVPPYLEVIAQSRVTTSCQPVSAPPRLLMYRGTAREGSELLDFWTFLTCQDIRDCWVVRHLHRWLLPTPLLEAKQSRWRDQKTPFLSRSFCLAHFPVTCYGDKSCEQISGENTASEMHVVHQTAYTNHNSVRKERLPTLHLWSSERPHVMYRMNKRPRAKPSSSRCTCES